MSSDDRQTQLLLVLQSLVRAARKSRGMITQQQLEKAVEGLDLSGEQLQMVRDYLRSNDIGIDEPLDFEVRVTDEEKDYLEEYRAAVEQMEQPSDGEKDAIRIRAMAGEKEAQRRLVEFMLPVVIDIARLYAGQGVCMEDLIGAGNEALVRAVRLLAPLDKPEDVDPALAERIMNAMEDLIAENLDNFSVDQTAAEQANLIMDKAQELAEMLGRRVSVEELAAEGEVSEEQILDAIRITGNRIGALEGAQEDGT